jgi:hypothetical protein
MIQRNHMMSAHRLSDVRHSQLLGRLSFLPAVWFKKFLEKEMDERQQD